MKALTKDRTGRKLNKQPNRDKAVARFVETIDYPRLEMILAADPRYHLLLQLMRDPLVFASGKGRLSFAAVLRKVNVPLADIQKVYIDGSKQLGVLELANRFPAIAADIGEDARSRDEACPVCQGEGSLTMPALEDATDAELDSAECKACKGSGTQRVMGDKHARDMVASLLGMGPKAGVTINNLLNQNANFGGGQDRIEDLLAKTARVIGIEAVEVEDNA